MPSDKTPRADERDADAALVSRARAGDDAAFGLLVGRHERAARALAFSLVNDWHEAEDLAQQAFVRAHRNLDLLADPARFGPWLARVVFGVSIDWLRGFRAEMWRADGGPLPELSTPEPDGLARLERDEMAARVLGAVRALPERYRVPLSLFHLDGLSQAKVAETLGMPAGTVRSLVTRARQRLRALLAPYAQDMMPNAIPEDAADGVFDERAAPRLLHLLNGDCTREKLEQSDVPGTFAVWADALYDGPVPPFEVGEDAWRDARARFVAGAGWASYDDASRMTRGWDAALARYPEYDETVIWLEHDLFDQLLLLRHLAWFARRFAERPLGTTALSLICVGSWPGMPDFKGLGELAPAELASLLGTRQRVTARQLELGHRGWRAFTAGDPRLVERFLAEEDTASLPFLAGALRRHLEEFPDARAGLSRTERQLLELVDAGVTDLGALFSALHRRETAFFIGDVSFLGTLRALAAGRAPLLRLTEGADRWWEGGHAALTDAGREVLRGRADRVALNGVDRWLGGAHVTTAPGERWRWDPDARQIRRIA